jgi:Holliday junction resolvase-like predicted endonuclease
LKYLSEKGFVIPHQNWRHSHREVDVIASYKNVLHFIEVKTRRNKKFGYPEDDVTKKKLPISSMLLKNFCIYILNGNESSLIFFQ